MLCTPFVYSNQLNFQQFNELASITPYIHTHTHAHSPDRRPKRRFRYLPYQTKHFYTFIEFFILFAAFALNPSYRFCHLSIALHWIGYTEANRTYGHFVFAATTIADRNCIHNQCFFLHSSVHPNIFAQFDSFLARQLPLTIGRYCVTFNQSLDNSICILALLRFCFDNSFTLSTNFTLYTQTQPKCQSIYTNSCDGIYFDIIAFRQRKQLQLSDFSFQCTVTKNCNYRINVGE